MSTDTTSARPAASARPGASPQPTDHPPAGYVPAFSGADGQEDPAPEAVVSSIALPASARPADAAGTPDDNASQIAEEISTDQQSDQARRVGQPPQPVDDGGPAAIPDPASAVAATADAATPGMKSTKNPAGTPSPD